MAGGLGDSPEGDEGRKGSSLEGEGREMTDEEKGTEGDYKEERRVCSVVICCNFFQKS